MLIVTATARFCCTVEKKGINLIKLCVISRLRVPQVFDLNPSWMEGRKKNNSGKVDDIISNDERLIIGIWFVVLTLITAPETSWLAS